MAAELFEYIQHRSSDQNVPPSKGFFDMDRGPNALAIRATALEVEDTLKQTRALYDKFHLHWSEDCVD